MKEKTKTKNPSNLSQYIVQTGILSFSCLLPCEAELNIPAQGACFFSEKRQSEHSASEHLSLVHISQLDGTKIAQNLNMWGMVILLFLDQQEAEA